MLLLYLEVGGAEWQCLHLNKVSLADVGPPASRDDRLRALDRMDDEQIEESNINYALCVSIFIWLLIKIIVCAHCRDLSGCLQTSGNIPPPVLFAWTQAASASGERGATRRTPYRRYGRVNTTLLNPQMDAWLAAAEHYAIASLLLPLHVVPKKQYYVENVVLCCTTCHP